MRFAELADIHERLRLGANKPQQVARIKNAEDALLFYEFFFPKHTRVSDTAAIAKVAHDAALYFDVARSMFPDDEAWMTLASESNKSASRSLKAADVLALPFESMTFMDIAYMFNEVEARLVWRYLTKGKSPISKRTFFGLLARQLDLPPVPIRRNTTRDTLMKMFDDPSSIVSLTEWWKYPNMFPAPARWSPWTKLHSPGEDYTAVIVPVGSIHYMWNGEVRTRTGEFVRDTLSDLLDESPLLMEFVDRVDLFKGHILDRVDSENPKQSFDQRMNAMLLGYDGAPTSSLSVLGSWEWAVEALTRDDVACVRLIHKDAVYEPDEVMGYVMYPHRSRVFLRLSVIDESHWELGALDGLHDYETVARIPADDTVVIKNLDEDSCIVVEVAVVNVNDEGIITNGIYIGMRPDMGISDVTQLTELIERGMDDASQ